MKWDKTKCPVLVLQNSFLTGCFALFLFLCRPLCHFNPVIHHRKHWPDGLFWCILPLLVLLFFYKESSSSVQLFRALLLEAVSALQYISADLLLKTVIILGQTLLKLHAGINGTGKGREGLLSCPHFLNTLQWRQETGKKKQTVFPL